MITEQNEILLTEQNENNCFVLLQFRFWTENKFCISELEWNRFRYNYYHSVSIASIYKFKYAISKNLIS